MKIDRKLDTYFYVIGWILIAFGIVMLILCMTVWKEFVCGLPSCRFHALTGYYCPGCGGRRSVICILRGEFLKSFLFHPITIYAGLVCGWFMISQSIERLSFGKIKIGMHFREIYLWIAFVLIMVNWIVKNALLFFGGIDLLKIPF